MLHEPGTVVVIDTATNTVIGSPIPVGLGPEGVAVTPDGSKVYVTNRFSGTEFSSTVSVIATATNTVIATVFVVPAPQGVAVTPDGTKVYVTGFGSVASQGVSVIDTVTNTEIARIPPGGSTFGVAVTPDGSKVYVTRADVDAVHVIDTATNTVIATIPGILGSGVAVTPDSTKAYVPSGHVVKVIDTATNTVIGSPIPVGQKAVAFGIFIQPEKPAPRFAGTPGKANCHGESVSALAQQFGGLNNAAAALGFASVSALQDAIMTFCEG